MIHMTIEGRISTWDTQYTSRVPYFVLKQTNNSKNTHKKFIESFFTITDIFVFCIDFLFAP